VAFRGEAGNQPDIQLVDPLIIGQLIAVGQYLGNVAHRDLNAQDFFGMHLAHQENRGLLFVVVDVVGNTHGIDGQAFLLGNTDLHFFGNIGMLCFMIGKHLRYLGIGVITGGQILGPKG